MPRKDNLATIVLAARGRAMLLAILWSFCAVTAFVGVGQIFSGSKAAYIPIVRFGLAVLLAYFVFKGSLPARVIFALLSGVASLMWLYIAIAVALPKFDFENATALALIAGYYALAAWAVFQSEPILAFWESRRSDETGASKTED